MSAVSGGGSCEGVTSVICLNVSQFGFRNFHLFTVLHAIGAVRNCEEIIDGRCCDGGNLSTTRRVGMPMSAVCRRVSSFADLCPCSERIPICIAYGLHVMAVKIPSINSLVAK